MVLVPNKMEPSGSGSGSGSFDEKKIRLERVRFGSNQNKLELRVSFWIRLLKTKFSSSSSSRNQTWWSLLTGTSLVCINWNSNQFGLY
jgi:hypothetical protein